MSKIINDYLKGFEDYEDDITKVDMLNNLSLEVERIRPLDSLELSKEAYNLALSIQYHEGIAKSLFRMGRSEWLLGDLTISLTHLLESLDICKNLNILHCEVEVLNTLGNVNMHLQIYDRALEYYIQSLKLARYIEFTKLEGALLNNIGEIFRELKDYDTALEYYNNSKIIYEKLNLESSLSIPLLNIGSIYYMIKNYTASKDYIELSLDLCKKNNDKIGECYSLHQLGNIYNKIGYRKKAAKFLQEGLSMAVEMGDKYRQVEILIDLHELMLALDSHENALECLNNALTLSEEINTKAMIAKVCSHLATVYEKMQNYEKTLYYYKKYHNTEKEANNYDLDQKLRSITAQFKVEQSHQEKEIYRLINVELKQKAEELQRKTKELTASYENVKIISDIGQSITSTLDLEKILIRVYENINNLMDANVFGIGLYDDESKEIHYKLYMEDSIKAPVFSTSLNSKSSWAVWCLNNRKEILINDVENQYSLYLENRKNTVGSSMESLIYCPLIVEDKVLGVMTVQSKKKNAYTQYNFDTVKALVSYIAIAINNAQESEKLAQEVQFRKKAQKELERLNAKLLKLSSLDGLTGVPNRRRFNQIFSREWEDSKESNIPISLLIIDIDYFKEYNDKYGHVAGDIVLRKIAKALENSMKRSTDFFARYGGDEFVAILPNTLGEDAYKVAEEMKEKIDKLLVPHDFSPIAKYVTITIGVACIIPHKNTLKEVLLQASDRALYVAKEAGRNRIEINK